MYGFYLVDLTQRTSWLTLARAVSRIWSWSLYVCLSVSSHDESCAAIIKVKITLTMKSFMKVSFVSEHIETLEEIDMEYRYN